MLDERRKRQVDDMLRRYSRVYDDRLPPDRKRQGRFMSGFEDVTVREKDVPDSVAWVLTWQNLGSSMGHALGRMPREEILEVYAYLSRRFIDDKQAQLLEEPAVLLPDESLAPAEVLTEGARVAITMNRYERNPSARKVCLQVQGTACKVCGFDFAVAYPGVAAAVGFIHVHHIVPISSRGGDYVVDPVADLVPLCANCHAAVHMREPPFAVEELKALRERPVGPS